MNRARPPHTHNQKKTTNKYHRLTPARQPHCANSAQPSKSPRDKAKPTTASKKLHSLNATAESDLNHPHPNIKKMTQRT
jgi:hypothetical protein